MAKQYGFQSNGVVTLAAPKQEKDNSMNAANFIASPFQYQPTSESDLLVVSPTSVQLNLEDLKCFEVVEAQFQTWGVIFRNCIAIHPSNPAFPPHSGNTVLMGAPKTGWLEAKFLQPVRWVSAFITSSQRLVLSAYDRNNQRLAQKEVVEPNLEGSNSAIAANTQLIIEAPNICRITFCAFDGQFTVDDFSFQFQV